MSLLSFLKFIIVPIFLIECRCLIECLTFWIYLIISLLWLTCSLPLFPVNWTACLKVLGYRSFWTIIFHRQCFVFHHMLFQGAQSGWVVLSMIIWLRWWLLYGYYHNMRIAPLSKNIFPFTNSKDSVVWCFGAV